VKTSLLLFGTVGGLGVPAAFTLAGWMLRRFAPGDPGALALLRDIQLPLWPMSKLILADPSSKHWLYLPLAAVLSNALIYAMVGAVSAWGRTNRRVFAALAVAVVGALFVGRQAFGSSFPGVMIAAAFAVLGLSIHHRGALR
jgi:hypothetical protein